MMHCAVPKIMVNPIYHPHLHIGGVNDDGAEFYLAQECNRLFRDKVLMQRLQMENLDARLSKLQKTDGDDGIDEKPHRLD